MAKKFEGAKKVKEIDEALNKALADFLFTTQGKLSKAAPVDTGRLASSFVLGKDLPNREVEPKRTSKGPVTVTRQYTRKEITMDSNWFISNNLPYAHTVAYNPIYGKNGRVGGAAWYTTILNNLRRDADRIFTRELKKVK